MRFQNGEKSKTLPTTETFENAITKEIHLYGNGNEDEFFVSGKVKRGVKLRLIGGLGKSIPLQMNLMLDSGAGKHGCMMT
ncbi:MAG: hypothetical protein U5K54_04930 [Cytophagales bacterium]|nr:hypothetical protein [Cytophagales bacterium]